MKRKITTILPYVLYGLLGLVLIMYKIGNYPLLWYDEGARLIMSRTLAETGNYATYSVDGFVPFNPWISAGPLDVLSVAAGIAVFGKYANVIRLALVPFSLLSMIMILIFGQKLFGKQAGWLAALTVLAVPPVLGNGFIWMSRQFMSENTSTAMAILAMFLWFRSWQTGKTSYSWVGGALLGLGMISKTQAAIWLMPALGLVWLLRLIQDRKRSWREIAFLISASLVIIAWYLFVNLQVPAGMQESNWQSMQASVKLLLFTVENRMISTTQLAITGIMFLVGAVVLVDLLRRPMGQRLANPVEWGQAMLAITSLFCVTWFFFLSIRYPRYSYTGWIFTLMLAGWLVWRFEVWLSGRKALKSLKVKLWLVPLTALILVMVNLAGNGMPLLKINGPIAAEEMGKFINKNIPPEAVIETTEMEIFGLTDHWEFHFAPNSAILTATRQIFYEQIQPQVSYDFLSYNPDYLITGPFSDWIHLYWSSGLVESDFVKLAEFPPYQVFQRKH
jgi:4-amino-4-deoxy-L-arabinose transferase-like glycosyltransferase